jgi:glutamyl-tRNA synthetase
VQRLDDVIEKAGFFFVDAVHPTLDDLIQKQMDAADTQRALQEAYDLVAETDDFSAEGLEVALRNLSDELGLKTSQFFGLLRVALTAQQVAPPLFETMVILGREACLARIQAAQALLVDTPV